MSNKALKSSMAPRLTNAFCLGNYATIFMTFVHSSRNTNFSDENKSEHQHNSLQQLFHKGAEFSLTKGTGTRTIEHGCWKGPQSSG